MTAKNTSGPQHIVCLTEESTETLYLLGEEHRIVGISGYTCRPKEARQQKPKVSAFTSGFVGLIVPHAVRILFGENLRIVLPGSLLLGAAFLVLADALARTVLPSSELPVGAITGLMGGPIFLWLPASTVCGAMRNR